MPDGSWFDDLPLAPEAAKAQLQQQQAPPLATQPQIVSRPVGQNSTSGMSSSAGWFDKLEMAPEAKPAPDVPRPTWAQQPRSVTLPDPKLQNVNEFGRPTYAPENGGAQMNADMRSGEKRMLEKGAEGATLGTFPYISAAAQTATGKPFSQGLQDARNYTNETSEKYPGPSRLAEGVGGVVPAAAAFGLGGGGLAGQAAAGAGLGLANSVGHDVGQGTTENIGRGTLEDTATGAALGAAGPLAGKALPAVPHIAQDA